MISDCCALAGCMEAKSVSEGGKWIDTRITPPDLSGSAQFKSSRALQRIAIAAIGSVG